MILSSPGSVAFSLLGCEIYYYGIIMALAVVSGFFVSDYVARRYYNLDDLLINIAPVTILCSLIGARLYFCVLDFPYYAHNLLEILNFRGGGLSIHGAIGAGILCLYFYSKKYKIRFSKMLDILAVSMPLGQAIGRWGNFFNSEAYGLPYDGWLKLYIAPQYRQEPYVGVDYFHPTFLYESILDFCLFVILFKLLTRMKSGRIFLLYLISYSLIRLFVEFYRIDASVYLFGLSFPQVVSIVIIVLSLLVWLVYQRR